MARLTLLFKDKTLQVLTIDAEQIGIGRDPENALSIDSLAVAPHHAVIKRLENGCMILRSLNNQYKVFVNDQPVQEHQLTHGDRITIGKHEVTFTEDPDRATTQIHAYSPSGASHGSSGSPVRPTSPEASLQAMNGANIGLVIALRNALTRLGKDETGSVIIARRKDGYYLSALTVSDAISVNDQSVDDRTVQLKHRDVIRIGLQSFRFHER